MARNFLKLLGLGIVYAKLQEMEVNYTEKIFDGSIIRVLRKQKDINQKELARLSGISNSYLSGVETGRTNPSLKTLLKIAEKLGTDISTFIQSKN